MPDASSIRHRPPARRLVSPAALSLMTGLTPYWVRKILRSGRVPCWRYKGVRLCDPVEFAELGLGLRFIDGGRKNRGISPDLALHSPDRRAMIGSAEKNRSDRGVRPDRSGDSRTCSRPESLGQYLLRRHLSDEF